MKPDTVLKNLKSNKTLKPPKWFKIKKSENYGWFPVVGQSMTDGTDQSITEGSLILCRELNLSNIAHVPTGKPLNFMLSDGQDVSFMLKTVRFIDAAFDRLLLHSYNRLYQYRERWISAKYIQKIFIVELVKRPDDTYFIP